MSHYGLFIYPYIHSCNHIMIYLFIPIYRHSVYHLIIYAFIHLILDYFYNLLINPFIQDGVEYGIESDHSTLVWTMKLFKEEYNQDNKSPNPLRYIKKGPLLRKF